MSRPASRFVEKLTKSQIRKLEDLMEHGDTPRIRHRAHAILLSHQGVSVVELAKVFQTNRTTISQWLDRWEVEGLEAGLADRPRPGSPSKLTETQRSRVVELLKESPQNPSAVLSQISQEMGKEISRSTLGRIAKKAGLVWKRMRKSLGSKRDKKRFSQHKRELTELKIHLVDPGEHDLYYFDEAGFSLTPSVPYGWQPIGERIELCSSRSQQLNVLGFMKHDGTHLDPYVFEGTIDTSIVIACIDNFCNQLTRPTTLVIDNAPVHGSALFETMIPKWEASNLYLWFLPPYSPELNLIEILWKQIKYRWMPTEAYESFKNLTNCLDDILAGFGKQFEICFK